MLCEEDVTSRFLQCGSTVEIERLSMKQLRRTKEVQVSLLMLDEDEGRADV